MADLVAGDFNQWSTTAPLISAFPSWVGEEGAQRIAAYQLYEEMYWNIPQALKVIQRGADSKPIYIPSARQIVETIHRYLAPGLRIIADPTVGTEAEQAASMVVLNAFLRRERFASKFSANKRYGIIRGDWLFQIFADPNRLPGARISIFAIDPASYFPITNEDNIDEIIGVHIAEQIIGDDGKTYIYRLTYRKTTGTGGPSPITVEEGIFKVDEWGGPGTKDGQPTEVVRPIETLPEPINAIPIYHIPNFSEPGSMWGSSEMRGLERIAAAIDQGISDEELTLAMEGLGVYTTDAGAPVDDRGQDVPWNLGPAQVIELPNGKTFKRVAGVSSVAPYQEHLKYLHEQLDQTATIPAVAKGRVDVDVAESGIALMLELGPLLARAEEGELVITDVLTNMLYDLKAWFQAYESINIGAAVWIPTYGDKIPVNRKAKFAELLEMLASTTPLVSAQFVRTELAKLGYEFPDDTELMAQILEEKQMVGQVIADVTGSRIQSELDQIPPPSGNGAGALNA